MKFLNASVCKEKEREREEERIFHLDLGRENAFFQTRNRKLKKIFRKEQSNNAVR